MLVTWILEVPCSCLAQDTVSWMGIFVLFFIPFRKMPEKQQKLYHTSLVIHSLNTLPFTFMNSELLTVLPAHNVLEGDQKYGSTHLEPWYKMEANQQTHVPTALFVPARERWYQLNNSVGGPQRWVGYFGKEKYFAPVRIQISDRPAHSLVPCIQTLDWVRIPFRPPF